MDQSIQGYISNISTWQLLEQQERSLAAKAMLDQEAIAALERRAIELGTEEVLQQLELDIAGLNGLEIRIVNVLGFYHGIKHGRGSATQKTIQHVRERGLIQAVETSVCKEKNTPGRNVLQQKERTDQSYEQIVLDYPNAFSPRAQWFARRSLGLSNRFARPPAATTLNVVTRATELIKWLAQRAKENDGRIPPFSNDDAALAIGVGPLRKNGVAQGMVQTRVDCACYYCDLPPLGCVAEQPFKGTWKSDGKNWEKQLQKAAQNRHWTPQDFEDVINAAQLLPSVDPWRDAQANEKNKIQTWLFRWAKGVSSNAQKDDRHLYRFPAEVLGRATPEFIWEAIQRFLDGTAKHAFGPSTDFDLVVDGTRLPPKAVFGVALELALGETVEPRNFTGGEGSVCFRLLREAGYSVVPKDAPASPTIVEEIEQAWAEGGRRLVAHWRSERATGISKAKKAQFVRENGRLFCERCGDDPVQKYGQELGDACIEVHHNTTMVSDMPSGYTTTLADLACLCANCHRVTHKELRLASASTSTTDQCNDESEVAPEKIL